MAWVLNACGAKPAMEGGQSDSSSEYGSVSEGGGASGNGDSTSFGDENVEKVDEYVVRPGDNLWNIARKGSVYHSGWLYPLILKANRGKIKNAKDLAVGLRLKIPRGLPPADYEVAREEAMAGVYEGEVGPLQDMKTDLPMAAPTAPVHGSVGAKGRASGRSWVWLIWLFIAALAGLGGWKLWKMRQKNPDEEMPAREKN